MEGVVIRCCRGNRKPNTNHCSDAVLAVGTEVRLAKGKARGIVSYIIKQNEDLQRILQ